LGLHLNLKTLIVLPALIECMMCRHLQKLTPLLLGQQQSQQTHSSSSSSISLLLLLLPSRLRCCVVLLPLLWGCCWGWTYLPEAVGNTVPAWRQQQEVVAAAAAAVVGYQGCRSRHHLCRWDKSRLA
jgi:hypothetical protein